MSLTGRRAPAWRLDSPAAYPSLRSRSRRRGPRAPAPAAGARRPGARGVRAWGGGPGGGGGGGPERQGAGGARRASTTIKELAAYPVKVPEDALPGNGGGGGPPGDDRGPEEPVLALEDAAAAAWDLGARWDALPLRWKSAGGLTLAFLIGSMDKVNMSVAVIPMALDYGWTPTTVGLIQSAFFYGYLAFQLPAGWLASRIGGRRLLPVGVLLFSTFTAVCPGAASNLWALLACRALVGAGEGILPACSVSIIGQTVPEVERSRATALTFSGLNLGSIFGLLLVPFLVRFLGWQSVFLSFGLAGFVWFLWYESSFPDELEMTKEAKAKLEKAGAAPGVPWRELLRQRPVQALTFVHFCNNWSHYTLLAWLPTYYKEFLEVDLTGASFFALLPPVVALGASTLSATLADALLGQGVPVTRVRKVIQGISFLGPALCFAGIFTLADGDPQTLVALVTIGLAMLSFSLAGLYCNHQDLSPKYASSIFGVTNTAGTLPGVLGVPFVGWLLEQTGSWNLALFGPSVFLLVSGALVYFKWGSGEELDLEPAPEGPAP